MMSKVNVKKEKIHGVQRALKSADKDANKKIDFKEFKADLILRGYTDDEINTVFTKYDINGDKILSEKEQIEMQQDLEGARAEIARETDDIEERIKGTDYNDDDDDGNGMSINSRKVKALNGVVYEEFAVLRSRVEKMEQSIGSIVTKIDDVLVKLEAMEKAKLKRKDSAISVLDRIDENQTSLEEQNYRDNQVSAAIVEEDNLDDDDEPI